MQFHSGVGSSQHITLKRDEWEECENVQKINFMAWKFFFCKIEYEGLVDVWKLTFFLLRNFISLMKKFLNLNKNCKMFYQVDKLNFPSKYFSTATWYLINWKLSRFSCFLCIFWSPQSFPFTWFRCSFSRIFTSSIFCF